MSVETKRHTRTAVDKRWDLAIDYILNTGTMSPYMDAFWQYIDGKITREQFIEEMPS